MVNFGTLWATTTRPSSSTSVGRGPVHRPDPARSKGDRGKDDAAGVELGPPQTSNLSQTLAQDDGRCVSPPPSPVRSPHRARASAAALATPRDPWADTERGNTAQSDRNSVVGPDPVPLPLPQEQIHARILNTLRRSSKFVDVDSGFDLDAFRAMYRLVFPQRALEGEALRWTEEVFSEIDEDNSGLITMAEIFMFLLKASRAEARRKQRPKGFRQWVWQFVGTSDPLWLQEGDDRIGIAIKAWKIASPIVVLVSIVVLMFDTMPRYQNADPDDEPGTDATFIIEAVCIGFFTLEFIGWCVGYPGVIVRKDNGQALNPGWDDFLSKKEQKEIAEKKRCGPFWRDVDTWIDILSIFPFYLNLVTLSTARSAAAVTTVRALRLIRLLRSVRLLRIGGGQSVPQLGEALASSKMSLTFLLLLIVIAMCVSATAIFYAELDQATFDYAQQKWIRDSDSVYDDAGQATLFQSIPESLWWSIVTLTTVGYGDLFPYTIGGKIVAGFTMLVGLIVVGYPITILTSTFQEMEKLREEEENRDSQSRALYNGIVAWCRDEDAAGAPATTVGESDTMEQTVAVDERGAERLAELMQASRRGSQFVSEVIDATNSARRQSIKLGAKRGSQIGRPGSAAGHQFVTTLDLPLQLVESRIDSGPASGRAALSVRDYVHQERMGQSGSRRHSALSTNVPFGSFSDGGPMAGDWRQRGSIPCAFFGGAGGIGDGEERVRHIRTLSYAEALERYPRWRAAIAARGAYADQAYRTGWEGRDASASSSAAGFGARVRLLLDVEDGLFDDEEKDGAVHRRDGEAAGPDRGLASVARRVASVMDGIDSRLAALEKKAEEGQLRHHCHAPPPTPDPSELVAPGPPPADIPAAGSPGD